MATKTKEITLADRLDRIEKLLFAPPKPSTQAATDASGNPGTVVAGELIESAWGNAVRDHVVRVYPNEAAMQAAPALDGQIAQAPVGTFFLHKAGGWQPYLRTGIVVSKVTQVNSGPYTGRADIPGLSVSFTGLNGRLYRARVYISHVEGHLDSTARLYLSDGTGAIMNSAWWTYDDNDQQTMICEVIFTANTTRTVKAQMEGGISPVNVTIAGSATDWQILTIEDLGLTA